MHILRSTAVGLAMAAFAHVTPSSAGDWFDGSFFGPPVFGYAAAAPYYAPVEDSTVVYTYSEVRVVRRGAPAIPGYAYLPPVATPYWQPETVGYGPPYYADPPLVGGGFVANGRGPAPYYAYGPRSEYIAQRRSPGYWAQPGRAYAPGYGPPAVRLVAPAAPVACGDQRYWNGQRCVIARAHGTRAARRLAAK